ncbi:hypothetical protein I5E68_07010 [Novosphingobium sp. YJ-S2-02]|uniref:Holin n=1 Tax=Novosphingobium aureum TaxID=2792964 RepID=A0A931HBF8_9SPHN|nr:hypothetical protein [Novosphingobium aureum]MBH0112699.1 hypothetical protein [Novosphingobium aureum]
MRGEAAAKYVPALVTAPLGAVDPTYAGIAFGMVTGWLAIVGVMYEQRRALHEIRRAFIVSVLIGGGGALFAMGAVRWLDLSPLGAAIASFVIAFGGVKTMKSLTNMIWKLFDAWVDDAAKMGRKRAEAARMLAENTTKDMSRLRGEGDEK